MSGYDDGDCSDCGAPLLDDEHCDGCLNLAGAGHSERDGRCPACWAGAD